MATTKKPIKTAQGTLTMTREDVAREFHCDRCDAPKKAKNIAQWEKLDGTTGTICNGCYGNILSLEIG